MFSDLIELPGILAGEEPEAIITFSKAKVSLDLSSLEISRLSEEVNFA